MLVASRGSFWIVMLERSEGLSLGSGSSCGSYAAAGAGASFDVMM